MNLIKSYKPKFKLLSKVSVPECGISEAFIVGIFDGHHLPEGGEGDGEAYQIKVSHKKSNQENGWEENTLVIVWPEFIKLKS